MKSLVLFAAAATALSAAPVAFADDIQAVVTYQQSQLMSADGLADLRNDIRQAAESVCIAPRRPTLRERRLRIECVDDAIEGAEVQVQQKRASLGLLQFAETQTLTVTVAAAR